MKYQLPTKLSTRKASRTNSVYFRIPKDLIELFNNTLINSTLRPQDLLESMVRHCLNDLSENEISLVSGIAK